MATKKIPLFRALLIILLSVVIVLGTTFLGIMYYRHMLNKRSSDDAYAITNIVQTGPVKEALKTRYLEEIIGLSEDEPINIYALDVKRVEHLLEETPVIEKVSVEKIEPDTLYVNYTVRQPIAYVYDFTNTAIDNNAFIFPITPFFTPKTLPKIYFGLDMPEYALPHIWGQQLQGKKTTLALELLKKLSQPKYADSFKTLWIDLSQAYADSYGQRQIVLKIEDNGVTYLLRLPTKKYLTELDNYLVLRKNVSLKDDMNNVIDLRVPQMAIITDMTITNN